MELLEALSIRDGDIDLDPQSAPTEDGLLHWCSSCVRRRAAGGLELAHFTVKEFLIIIDSERSPQFSEYRMTECAHYDIARTCLTYLNATTFNTCSRVPRDIPPLVEKHPILN